VRITARAVGLALVGVLLAGGLLAVQPSASAAPCVRIYRIWYNSPGPDNGSNASLNAEWIQLKNYCRTGRSLTRWNIQDAVRHTYVFGDFGLGGGRLVKLHTGRGKNTATDVYWGRRAYVWNNDKDTAYLYNRRGGLVDTCSYNNRHADNVYC
jgi:hypothetical protein